MKSVLLVCVLFLLPALLRADILFLSDQKYIRGTIVSQTTDEIVFKDENGIEKKYKKRDVRRAVYQTPEEQEAADLKLEKARTRQDKIDQAAREKRERVDPRPEPVVSDAYIPTETSSGQRGFLFRMLVLQNTGPTDIEARLREQKFYTAGLYGLIGLSAPWSKSTAYGLPLELEYSFTDLHFELSHLYAWSRPRATGFELGNAASAAAVGRTDFADVNLLVRRPMLIARYDLSRGDYTFAALGGVRQTRRSAEFDLEYFPVTVLNASGLANGGSGRSLANRVRTQSRDLIIGGDMSVKTSPRSELQFRLTFLKGRGYWRENYTAVDLISNGTGSGLIRNQDARYLTRSTELRFGYAFQLQNQARLLTRFTLTGSTTRTGRNLLTRFETNSNDAAARYLADWLLSGPGRTAPEQAIGLEIGGEFGL